MVRVSTPITPPPDEKDWTWTLDRVCPDCGFDPSAIAPGDIAAAVAQATRPWQAVLLRPDVRERPAPTTWSALEYGAHVRDVCRVFLGRVDAMLTQDDPHFDNWDQDQAALDGRYWEQEPSTVAAQIDAASAPLSARYAGVPDDAWSRPGLRSNGSSFTVATLGTYLVHDLVHHLWDVRA